jgi:anti-anti-sigma factor
VFSRRELANPKNGSEPASPQNGSVTSERLGASTVIRVRPPVDADACHQLGAQLAEAEASDAERILLDLDALESIDARLLHTILKASRRAAQDGDRLRVTRGNGHVSAIFRLTALDQTLRFDD